MKISSSVLRSIAVQGLTCLSLLTGPSLAIAAPPATPIDDKSRKFMITMLETQCDQILIKREAVDNLGRTSEVFDASNGMLHKCQYVQEMRASGCVAKGNCQGYDAWSKAYPSMDPELPRDMFLRAFEGHRGALVSASKASAPVNGKK